jgi:starch phosphorylase
MNGFDAIPPSVTTDLQTAIRHHLKYSVGESEDNATLQNWRIALSLAIRDRVIEPWFRTGRQLHASGAKRVYYLSMEFLIGRLLADAVANLGLDQEARDALNGLGLDFETVVQDEPDAALGNGGLGRLAACFLDSMSTIGLPAFGYGIRYHHGLFKQSFDDGWQVEEAEDWLNQGHAWEFERVNALLTIGFGGNVETDARGRAVWRPSEMVAARAYDTPIPGWRGQWVNTLRLWDAHSTEVFDLEPFNRGDFIGAAASSVLAETISRILYPDDTTHAGRQLRLKQEYFFTAASLRDLVHRFLRSDTDLRNLPKRAAIQLNDTHPAIAAPELVRILVDDHGLAFEDAFATARATLNYTNHTLMPEALESWSYDLMAETLPRHLQIIEQIDDAHAAEIRAAGCERPGSTAIIADGAVRMGNLAFIAANRVNGVSGLHTDLMRETVFRDLHALHPEKILSQTNGVTPRRWLRGCNHGLSALLTETVGDGWETDLERLSGLRAHAEDAQFQERFRAIKRHNKANLAAYVSSHLGLALDPDAMFDIQIKRIHEYKRQLLNILEAAATWNAMKREPGRDWPARVRLFGGKAAPGYAMAKLVIKLINDIAATINADPETNDRLRIAYIPNYNVSKAELMIPAADLSEQISTAGMEASGTGNMKFALNGALTIGTLDGANVEIREHVGPDNIVIFGQTAAEVAQRRADGYDPGAAIEASPALLEVIEQIESGVFSPDDPGRFHDLTENLRHHDWFMVCADFDAYNAAQRTVDGLWAHPSDWTRRAILNTSAMGWFSSDRTIRGYAADIWDAEPTF